jgi:hypothetical protein
MAGAPKRQSFMLNMPVKRRRALVATNPFKVRPGNPIQIKQDVLVKSGGRANAIVIHNAMSRIPQFFRDRAGRQISRHHEGGGQSQMVLSIVGNGGCDDDAGSHVKRHVAGIHVSL